jgi:uncharacterized protein (DUF433 family)
MATETRYEHIILATDDVPTIAGTTMKVVELVLARLTNGWSPEELHFQFPQLTLGQIHSALAYYWDHKQQLDQDIQTRLAEVEQLQKENGPSALVARLRAQGLL